MIQYEMNRRDAAITTLRSDITTLQSAVATVTAERDTAWTERDNAFAKLAEYERRFGTLNGDNQ